MKQLLKKLLNMFKEDYLPWKEYQKKVAFTSQLSFQQQTHKENITNLPSCGNCGVGTMQPKIMPENGIDFEVNSCSNNCGNWG